jgi:hypothetical protein
MDEPETNETAAAEEVIPPPPGLRQDLGVLMKVRLNFFVLVTTFFGFLLYSLGPEGMHWMKLLHTILGTAAAAFGSAAFNQLMEVDLDARMKRTADRPLPRGGWIRWWRSASAGFYPPSGSSTWRPKWEIWRPIWRRRRWRSTFSSTRR